MAVRAQARLKLHGLAYVCPGAAAARAGEQRRQLCTRGLSSREAPGLDEELPFGARLLEEDCL